MYSLKELRLIAEGYSITEGVGEQMSLQEAFNQFILDESYFGKKPIAKIQTAMDIIFEKVSKNSNIDLRNDPSNKELQKAICEQFGFKQCSIYWSNKPYATDAYTCVCVKILHTPFITYNHGNNSNGFYDDNHELKVFIDIDQNMITAANMTSEEMVAILLHEIGHNFDYSLWSITGQWCGIFAVITRTVLQPTRKNFKSATGLGLRIIGVELAPGLYQDIRNIDNLIMNTIPPIGIFVRTVSHIGVNVYKLFGSIIKPVKSTIKTIKKFKNLPVELVMLPFNTLGNLIKGTFNRRGEIYADSFAVSYGYGAELATALEKLTVFENQAEWGRDSFIAPFYDFTMLQSDIIDVFTGSGTDTQRRIVNMIGKMDQDLEQSGLSHADIDTIKEERARIVDAYEHYLNAEEGARAELTSSFRQMIDNWYAGKNYMFLPTLDRDNLYAK